MAMLGIDFIELGPVPSDEESKQSGYDSYSDIHAQTKSYAQMLNKRFPIPENVRAWFAVKRDGGGDAVYCECVIKFDENDVASRDFAYFVEENLPARWNDAEVITFFKQNV